MSNPADVRAVAALARRIWTAHYVPIIGSAQTEYMLSTIQSVSAISEQIRSGCEYYLARAGREQAGYFALALDDSGREVLLSKLYVLGELRGSGCGKAMLACAESRGGELGGRELWLTVNRHNRGAIGFYRRRGFKVTGTLVRDIGRGFVMDDFRMAKPISPPGA